MSLSKSLRPLALAPLIFVNAMFAQSDALTADSPDAKAAPKSKPTINPVTPPAKEIFHIYLLMGQSNMAGRDVRSIDKQVDNSRVLAFTADSQWVVARDPIHVQTGRTIPGAGPGVPFGKEMIKTVPENVSIGLVPCAVGGTPLRRWVKGGDLYEQALAQAKLAAKFGIIKGILWHQGESDSSSQKNADTYGDRLAKMLQDFRKDLGQPDLPIVVGQIGDFVAGDQYQFVDTVRAAIKDLPARVPHIGYADAAGLGDKGDKLHFSAESQQTMGEHFATAMRELQK